MGCRGLCEATRQVGGTSGLLHERKTTDKPCPLLAHPRATYSNAGPRSCSCRASKIRFNSRKGCLKSQSTFSVDSCGQSMTPRLKDSVSKTVYSNVVKPHLPDRLERARVCVRCCGLLPASRLAPHAHFHSGRLTTTCWPSTGPTTTSPRS